MAKKRGLALAARYTPPKERDPLAPLAFAEQLVARMLINTHGLWTSEVPQFDPETGRRMRARWNQHEDDGVREGLRQYFVATLVHQIQARDALIYTNAVAAANPQMARAARVIDWDDMTEEELDQLAAEMAVPDDSPLAQAHREIRALHARIRELEERLAGQMEPETPAAPEAETPEAGTPEAETPEAGTPAAPAAETPAAATDPVAVGRSDWDF